MFLHGGFQHILFNMLALWMFGNQLENYWGGKKFLNYYILCGIGSALVHYIIFSYQVYNASSIFDAYALNPTVDSLNNIISEFLSSQSSIEMQLEYKNFSSEFNQLIIQNPQLAMNKSIAFVDFIKQDYLNAPVIIGASGAVFGLLLAFGMTFPNQIVYVQFFIPMKAKWFVVIYGGIELFMGISNNQNDNVAHFAHLGGMLVGFILLRIWKSKGI
jgi:membrane associated rhomboid family serine protease